MRFATCSWKARLFWNRRHLRNLKEFEAFRLLLQCKVRTSVFSEQAPSPKQARAVQTWKLVPRLPLASLSSAFIEHQMHEPLHLWFQRKSFRTRHWPAAWQASSLTPWLACRKSKNAEIVSHISTRQSLTFPPATDTITIGMLLVCLAGETKAGHRVGRLDREKGGDYIKHVKKRERERERENE